MLFQRRRICLTTLKKMGSNPTEASNNVQENQEIKCNRDLCAPDPREMGTQMSGVCSSDQAGLLGRNKQTKNTIVICGHQIHKMGTQMSVSAQMTKLVCSGEQTNKQKMTNWLG